MIDPRRLGLIASVFLLLLGAAGIARAADADGSSALAAGTVAAIPSDETAASVRPASASVFRPAPMPGEDVSSWSGNGGGGGEAALHPEILSMHQAGNGGGAMTTASSDYDHDARMRPAGGMGLTIPMQ